MLPQTGTTKVSTIVDSAVWTICAIHRGPISESGMESPQTTNEVCCRREHFWNKKLSTCLTLTWVDTFESCTQTVDNRTRKWQRKTRKIWPSCTLNFYTKKAKFINHFHCENQHLREYSTVNTFLACFGAYQHCHASHTDCTKEGSMASILQLLTGKVGLTEIEFKYRLQWNENEPILDRNYPPSRWLPPSTRHRAS